MIFNDVLAQRLLKCSIRGACKHNALGFFALSAARPRVAVGHQEGGGETDRDQVCNCGIASGGGTVSKTQRLLALFDEHFNRPATRIPLLLQCTIIS